MIYLQMDDKDKINIRFKILKLHIHLDITYNEIMLSYFVPSLYLYFIAFYFFL